ncbi:MAG: DUF4091 domain-containing protein, partial [Fibrobacteres bacterium]|nr:DUF4091 domain-containing protein [Fibrobacterota bacterium]
VDGKKAVTGPLNNPVFDTLLTSAIRQFKNKIESYGFEMVLLIYDEPTERLMTQLAYRHPKIKEAFPSMRIYGVTMDMLQWAQQIAPYSDILVSNGSFSSISSYAKTNNKDFWVYQEATSSMSPSQVRESYGIRFAKYKPGAIFFWAYNYYSGNPYTFPDGDETGQTIVFPPSASNGYQPTGSPAWEGLREAHDDWRYVKTLESMLATATGTAAARISTEFNNTKIRITDYGTNRSSMYDSLRTVFAGWINEIIKEEGSKFTDMTIEAEMNIAAAASGKSMMVLTPNPFNPTAKLYIPLSLFGNMLPEVTMHATDGRIVKRIRLTHQANSLTAEIASGDLAAGMYVLRAAAGNKIFTIRAAVIR